MLAAIVGREHMTAAGAELSAAAVDGILPRWRVRTGSVDEVSRVMALAGSEGLAVAPRGSGSALDLGMPPARVDVALDLSRLAGIMEYVPADMVATVQAGVRLDVLERELRKHGQMLALDPYGGPSRTVGGVLASGASGPRRFRYGTGRDLLLGTRFVQADGTITWGGAKVVKSVTGYDVPKLLVGSLGTLGVLVEATLRLHPMPPLSRSWQLGFSAPEGAREFLAALLDSPLQPDRAALLDAGAVRQVGLTADPIAFLISLSSVAEAVEAQGRALERLAAAHGGGGDVRPESIWSGLGPAAAGPILLRAA